MSFTIKTICLAFAAVSMYCVDARADGGAVRWSEKRDGVELTVFTSPNPLRAGPVDVSVLVQNAGRGDAIPDADVQVRLIPHDRTASPVHAVATHADATNKLLQAALVEVPSAGVWEVEVECTTAAGAGTQTNFAKFSMEAGPPLPRWLAVWPWFTWPVAAILLFGVHRHLVARKQASR
jgi:hypothetical protein